MLTDSSCNKATPSVVVLGSDDSLVQSWCEQLRARGCVVFAAADLATAIAAAQERQPDGIVTAVALPNTSLQFVRALRSVVENDVKIVGIAEASQLTLNLSGAGFDLIVTAPVDFHAIQQLIGSDVDDLRSTTKMSSVKAE